MKRAVAIALIAILWALAVEAPQSKAAFQLLMGVGAGPATSGGGGARMPVPLMSGF